MNTFAWRPKPPEIQAVVRGIFVGMADDGTLDLLASKYGSEPLSFFAQVRLELLDIETSRSLSRAGYDMRHLLKRDGVRDLVRTTRPVSPQDLFDIAERVQVEQRAATEDFLGKDQHGGGEQ